MAAPSPQTYRVTVEGELPPSMDLAFDGLTLERSNGETTLMVDVRDQMQLYTLLQDLGDLALTLLALERVKPLSRTNSPLVS